MAEPFVLLVEPDESRRMTIADAIERERFHVVAVAGSDAAERAPMLSPQLVVVSLLGGALLDLVRSWADNQDRAAIPLLAVTAAGDDAAAREAIEAGAEDVLPWPADQALLRARLRATSRASGLAREVADFEGVLGTLVATMEAHEPYSIEHSRRVSQLAESFGLAAGLAPAEAERARRAGLVYDIGFVAVPDALRHAERAITSAEFALIRSHPVVGYELLRRLPSMEPLAPFVLRHHERLDGSGYPDGLSKSEIPLAIQVLSVADAYDALTSARAYRPVRSPASAWEMLRDEARRGLWDAELLRACEKTLEVHV